MRTKLQVQVGTSVCARFFLLAVAICAGAIGLRADDTMIATGDYLGTLWGSGTLWASGSAPTNAGVVLDTGSGGPQIRLDETNRVAGRANCNISSDT